MPDLNLELYLDKPELTDSLDCVALAPLLVQCKPREGQCKALEGRIFALLLTERDSHASSPDGDRLLTCDEAAALLSVPRAWLYRRGAKLGLAIRLDRGTLRFSNTAIQNYLRTNRSVLPK